MLAMHYAIELKDADQVASVRARAAERGPLFDNLPGLTVKLFLIDAALPCYATFYLWHDPDAARNFLNGSFFQALSDTFGRPEVRLLLTDASDLPFAVNDILTLQINPPDETAAVVRALDPRGGDILSLAPASAPGRKFEVMYRALGEKL